jgi:AraC family transcriptional regulator
MTNVADFNGGTGVTSSPNLRPVPSTLSDWRLPFPRLSGQKNAWLHPREQYERRPDRAVEHAVEVSPHGVVERRALASKGIVAEIVQATAPVRIESHFCGSVHLLVASMKGARVTGQTSVEGLAPSSLRDTERKLTFVPAGHIYRDWQEPRSLPRTLYVYFDPRGLQIDPTLRLPELSLRPRVFFENAALWETTLKLARLIDESCSNDQPYFEALCVVLGHELARLTAGTSRTEVTVRGGLAAWQERIVIGYIEEHLSEQVSLAKLAQLVRLNPNYFCRAFRQCFGMPPHRYHCGRRIERAKVLLAQPTSSITDIGFELGFNDTSAFSRAFRKATGHTPTSYRRALA